MTTEDLMKLADKFAFFMPGSEEGEKARQALFDALEALGREVAELKRPKEKIAPVQGWPQGIPWSLHLEAYAVYSKKWAPQPALIDLEGRNCRGGFSVGELDEFIPGWRERVSELAAVKAERDAIRAELAAIRAQDPVAYALGDARCTYSSNIFAAHEFVPDAEHADEWTALYASPADKDAGLVADGCVWTQDSDFEMGDTYDSGCGEKWSFIDGGPAENNVRFCQGCGKPVKLAASPKIGGV